MDWREHLKTRLQELRPESVCALDEAAQQLAAALLPDTPVRRPGAQPCALALGIDALNGLEPREAQHLISQAQLYAAPHLLIAAFPGCALGDDSFRSLGFALSATDAAANVSVYDYALATYKAVPDWLNARFWAHPERW